MAARELVIHFKKCGDSSDLNLDDIFIGYTGGTSQTHRSPSNGRAGGSMGKSMVVGVAGVDVEQRPRDSSLPRVYEDPDELASSNQVYLK